MSDEKQGLARISAMATCSCGWARESRLPVDFKCIHCGYRITLGGDFVGRCCNCRAHYAVPFRVYYEDEGKHG